MCREPVRRQAYQITHARASHAVRHGTCDNAELAHNDARMSSALAAAAAGLVRVTEHDSTTSWAFKEVEASAVRPVKTRCGVGLVATHALRKGDVILADRWLVGIPVSGKKGCEHCLRVCAWSPVDESCPGCGARYCGKACRDAAWSEYHCLLCTGSSVGGSGSSSSSVHPLEVFAKHARLAPMALQQKPEEVLLAARMLARSLLWDGDDAGAATKRSVVPPPFERLESYCVVGHLRPKLGQPPSSDFQARSKWMSESYRLLAASALGKHANFAAQCPPHVYSHCLGIIDRNAASVSALAASALHAARAGIHPTVGGAIPAPTADGIGVFPLFSFANHACAPNAINVKGPADGDAALDNRLVLRAACPVAAGEEITFDYLDIAHEAKAAGKVAPSAAQRRAVLRESFGFDCACSSCAG